MSGTSSGLVTIVFGSNRFVDTNGVISFEGKEFFRIDDLDLVTVEIRGKDNILFGKVWKSSSWVYIHQDYESVEEDSSSKILKKMVLKRKSDGHIIFELSVLDKNTVEINGTFYFEGFPDPIIATNDYLKIGTNTIGHNTFIRTRRGIDLRKTGFSLG